MNNISNIRVLFALRFFSSLIPAYVIERLYWEERGMTIQMVVYTEIIFALTIVLLEVPTGVIADKWGRKKMLVLSALLGCCEFLILIVATEFWHFALVVFLGGIARSASSGSENALLYDTLMQQGKGSHFEKLLGRLNACDLLSAILAALCGSLLAGKFGLELNYWLSLLSSGIALMLAFLLIEPQKCADVTDAEEAIPFKTYVTASLRFFRKNPNVSLVMLSGMVTGASMSYVGEFWQLYASRLETPVYFFGVLSSVIMLLQLPGNLLSYALLRRFTYKRLIVCITAMNAVGFLCVSFCHDFIGLAAMLIICLFSGVMQPLASGYLHHRIESNMRATIDSFQSLGENVLSTFAGFGFGYFAARYDVFGGYGFIALLCFASFVWFVYASRSIKQM
ncbi:MFS transporter [Paenibacillus sp. CGMCC 1.16610]|uniref:MFS transporter n=1 Tax=Paenibacillus anseongense TaxID=2682845 RepID=A0ABW9UD64_9BACL|nr:MULTISPECIES: MFS transporter [Paenibacillus]MBA2938254.1 MFS transporter [Paenibacillus sp. CGMCC 1.16610]MVQ37312.1 MFS transporter [Paenibacillus anseongense]